MHVYMMFKVSVNVSHVTATLFFTFIPNALKY